MEKIRHYVSVMSYNLQETQKMKLNCLLRSIAEHPIIYSFVLDDINRIISTQLW